MQFPSHYSAERIPIELIQNILLYDQPSYPKDRGSMHAPMQVSRRWRAAALSCSELWTTIYIHDFQLGLIRYKDGTLTTRSYEEILGDFSLESLSEWLRRSSCAPLNIIGSSL